MLLPGPAEVNPRDASGESFFSPPGRRFFAGKPGSVAFFQLRD